MPVFLADEQSDHPIDGDDLVDLATHVMQQRRVPAEMELSLLLVDVQTMTALNGEHMGKDGPTDVLAFPMDEPDETPLAGPAILGDVVLCPQVATTQAAEHDRSAHDELRLLTVHGILHLLGMDHDDPTAEREMFTLTDTLLASHRAGATSPGDAAPSGETGAQG